MSNKPVEDQSTQRVGGTTWSAYTEHKTELGVRFEEDQLLWRESPIFNPHGGGGAAPQPLADSLANGPAFGWLSEAALAEPEAAVRLRVLP